MANMLEYLLSIKKKSIVIYKTYMNVTVSICASGVIKYGINPKKKVFIFKKINVKNRIYFFKKKLSILLNKYI